MQKLFAVLLAVVVAPVALVTAVLALPLMIIGAIAKPDADEYC